MIVVDASIVHPATIHPKGVAMGVLLDASSLHSPDLVLLEVAGSLRNRVIRREIEAAGASQAIGRLRRLPIVRHPVLPLIDRVWELRDNMTPYDAAYAALAERLEAPLTTADEKMAKVPGLRCEVRLVDLQ